MNNKNYVVYHLHSDYSNCTTIIDSATKPKLYVDRAKELGMTALAFSEHGNVLNWYEKKEMIERAGMKYIHGVEAYITEYIGTNELGEIDRIRDNYHCVLLAKNEQGFREINKLVSIANNRKDGHFYYVPRITMDEFLNISENVIITTACLGGCLWSGNESTKRKYINYLIKNRDRCFLEIQHHNVPDQIEYNKQLYELSKKYALKLVAGTDTHSLNNELAEAREVLQKSKNIRFENETGWDLTFKSYDELVEAYRVQGALPEKVFVEAIDNTNLIADMVEEYHFDGTPKYPKLYDNSSEIFRDMVYDAIDTHPDALKNHTREEIVARVEEELPVYEATKTVDFMLFQKFVRDTEHSMGIYTGPGRGSVSASMIAYLLGITDVDSMRFGLELFRFLNPSRVTNCDIDSDYYDPDRVKMRNFLLTYPKIRSAEIAAFGTIALRGAIDDVGRAFGIPLQEVKEIKSRIIVDENGVEDFNPNDKQKYPELVHFVNILQGVITSVGTHPAGVLCATRDIDEEIGLFSLSTTEHPVSCLDMHWLDTGEMSWTKLDMLG